MALWASYNFYIVGESCQLTNSETFGELWTKTVSLDSAWIVQTIVTVAPVISCLANTIVLTDVLRVVLRSAGAPLWFYQKRVAVIATLCSFILYPICTVKDLSSLKSVSAFGLLGQLAAMSAFAVRIADKSYQAGGKYFAAASTVAPVATRGITSQWFILASIMSYCYVAHYNAPKYYTELSVKNDKTTDNGGTGGISKSRRFYRYTPSLYIPYIPPINPLYIPYISPIYPLCTPPYILPIPPIYPLNIPHITPPYITLIPPIYPLPIYPLYIPYIPPPYITPIPPIYPLPI